MAVDKEHSAPANSEEQASNEAPSEGKVSGVPRWLVVTAALALTGVAVVIVYGSLARPKPDWIGVANQTFWDYLDLIIVPVVLVIGGYLLDQAQSERVRKADEAQQKREQDAENARRKRELDVEKRRAENEYRKEFLMHILRAYNGAKKVRRVLAAHRSDDKKIPCSVYEAQMEALMDSQLELEIYKPYQKVWPDTVRPPNALLPAFDNEKKREEISASVRELEQHLNHIIEEYDKGDKSRYAEVKKKLRLSGPSSMMPLQCLPALQQFVETGSFKEKFSSTVHKLQKQVKEEIQRAHSTGAE